MSHLSALEREKNELEKIKTKLREGDKTPEDAVIEATGREEHPLKDVVKKDGKLEALKRKLTRMTDSLAAEIEKVDSSLGDRLHIIDRDNDGVVDLEELRDAIAAILRAKGRERGTTFQDDEVEEFVANIMTEIDVNDDGIMTVEELEKWYENYFPVECCPFITSFARRHEELINTRNKVTSSE